MNLEAALFKHFQFTSFRPGQKETISAILEGNNTLSMLPTGTGKSLCYQLPGYILEGQVMIVSPLLSLMQDQVEQMRMRGEKRVVALNSFLTPGEKRNVLANIHKYKFLFISPEMLSMDAVVDKLQNANISLFVIDEAHCISQWGYDFRPDYQKLGELRRQLGNPLTLALTATAAKEVRQDIVQSLALPEWKEVVFSVDRPNIAISVEHLQDHRHKLERVLQLIREMEGPGIIYFSSKKVAEQTAAFLHQNGIYKVMAYHGGVEQESRILIQQQFLHGQLDIICATSAFGMGINKENIRYIIHFHLPLQLESYLQEIGRAGRDGKPAAAFLLYAPGDEQLSLQLAKGELPVEAQVRLLFAWLVQNRQAAGRLLDYEDDLRRMCGFTDVQWRIIENFMDDFREKDFDINEKLNEVTHFINERLAAKRTKLDVVRNWIWANSCLREQILHYFGEKKTINIENCCSYCGIDVHVFARQEGHQEGHQEEQQGIGNWKNYLAGILLKS